MDSGSIGMALTSSMNQPARMSAFVAFGMLVVSLPFFSEPPHPDRCCRIFNAHKNSTTDRQIGDRRWVNGSEYHPTGNKQEVNWPCFRSQRLLPSGKGHSAEGRFQLFAFSFPRFCCFSGIHSLKRSLDQFLEKPMVTDMV